MQNKEFIHVGTFGQPQGLKGGIKINILTLSLDSFQKLDQFFLEKNYSDVFFKSLKKNGKNYLAFLEGCNDRSKALEFKGKKIFALRKNFPKTKYNEYYIIDLIGCDVINIKKNLLGKIIDIKNFGAGDLFEIQNTKDKNYFIPINNDNVLDINIQKKKIIVNPMLGLID